MSDPTHADGASKAAIVGLLEEHHALLRGHFRLSSGLHAERYVQCQAVMAWPEAAARLGQALADRFSDLALDCVLGPALGAVVLAHEVARARGCRSLFAERREGSFALRRGQAFREGERVLVVENVVTTGGSAREVLALIESLGATPVAVGALIDRSPADLEPFPGLPFHALLAVDAPALPEAECPRCARGEPLESPGSRYLQAR